MGGGGGVLIPGVRAHVHKIICIGIALFLIIPQFHVLWSLSHFFPPVSFVLSVWRTWNGSLAVFRGDRTRAVYSTCINTLVRNVRRCRSGRNYLAGLKCSAIGDPDP